MGTKRVLSLRLYSYLLIKFIYVKLSNTFITPDKTIINVRFTFRLNFSTKENQKSFIKQIITDL
jgi:hypothetical protein